MEFTGFYKKQSMYVFFWNKESMKCNLLPMFFEGFWELSWYIAEIFLKKQLEEFFKRAILKISQTSDESTCVGVSILINLHVSGLQLYKKKRLRHKYTPLWLVCNRLWRVCSFSNDRLWSITDEDNVIH